MVRKIFFIPAGFILLFTSVVVLNSCAGKSTQGEDLSFAELSPAQRDEFINDLKSRTFRYFWEVVDTNTWQNDDRFPTYNFTSIAATGFALPSFIIGVENNFISRQQASERVLNTLEWLWSSKQGAEPDATGYKGFYYHFLSYGTGRRYDKVELSTIDTGLLLAGILTCQTYFDGADKTEVRIRELADSIYLRVDWQWAMNGAANMSMGWTPEQGFIQSTWNGYNEAMILLIMAIGSPTHPIDSTAWDSWCSTYKWDSFYGYEHVPFGPLFGHQYSHQFIDFRGIQDSYMRSKGIDYFENSVRATLSNRAYCMENPLKFEGYSANMWGLTACDGPAMAKIRANGRVVQFYDYRARSACSYEIIDDGTIAPTAAGGSIPFAPEECLSALYTMKTMLGSNVYREYGFVDAFNLTVKNGSQGWFDRDYLGIDQGPILIQLENYQSGLIWNLMKKNRYIVSGLKKAGFRNGWLEQS